MKTPFPQQHLRHHRKKAFPSNTKRPRERTSSFAGSTNGGTEETEAIPKTAKERARPRVLIRSLDDTTGDEAFDYGSLFDTGAIFDANIVAGDIADELQMHSGVPIKRYKVPKRVKGLGGHLIVCYEFIKLCWMIEGKAVDPQSWPTTTFSVVRGAGSTLGQDFIFDCKSIDKLNKLDIYLGI